MLSLISNKKKINIEKLEKSFEQIISLVAEKSGVPRCVRFNDGSTVAFSGSIDEPDLLLELAIDKKDNLYASLDDEVSWYEFDFENTNEFIENIANYIAPLVNHTVKYIREHEEHKYVRFKILVLDEDKEEWITLEDEKTDIFLVRPFIPKDRNEEKIKVYNI